MYPEDLVIFTRENVKESTNIHYVIGKYCNWYRQRVNFNKSIAFISRNLNGALCFQIRSTLQIQKASTPIKYLGNFLSLITSKK